MKLTWSYPTRSDEPQHKIHVNALSTAVIVIMAERFPWCRNAMRHDEKCPETGMHNRKLGVRIPSSAHVGGPAELRRASADYVVEPGNSRSIASVPSWITGRI